MPEEMDAVEADATPSADTSADQSSGSEIASDLFDDDAPQREPTPAANGTSDLFDPSSVDIRRTKLDDIPENHRAYFEPAYKALKNLESGYTKRDQDLADAQRRAEAVEQEWRDRIQQIAAPPEPTEAEQLDEQLSGSHLNEEQRQGVEVVRQLIAAETQPLLAALNEMQSVVPTVQHWQQQQEQQSQNALSAEIADAKEAHGDDVEEYGEQIAALINTVNPQTGATYTVRESYELVTGKAQQAANNARQTDANTRQATKNQITSPQSTVVSHEGQGDLSIAEARAELEALGFER
jgi:hypothetical protein